MLKIEYPSSHELDQIEPLFVDFVRQNPEVVSKWTSLEMQRGAFDERADLDEISQKVQKYLIDNCDVVSRIGLLFAWGDFRKLLWEQIIRRR